jgi:hypothetical protein
MIRISFILGLLAAGIGAALAGGDESRAQAIRDALAAGQPVVLAVAHRFPPPDAENEGYADWAAYLNAFAADHKGYAVMGVERQEAAKLLADLPELESGYATIFVRSPTSAVIYDGPILEDFVYEAAAGYLEASEDGRFDGSMFEPFDFRLRE